MESKDVELTVITAHPGKRFQGQFIDGIVTYFLGYLSFYILGFFVEKDIAGYTAIAIGLLYFLLSDSLPDGQSIGKRLLNIQVLSEKSKQPCSLIQSFFRNIIFPLGILDWIFILFGPNRRLGDFLASTIVVKKFK